MSREEEIVIEVIYGLGAAVSAVVPREVLASCTVREAIEMAIKTPRASGSPEERAAVVISEALRKRRPLDVEVSSGSAEAVGQPVGLEDALGPVLSPKDHSQDTEASALEEEVHIFLSEPYRGGV